MATVRTRLVDTDRHRRIVRRREGSPRTRCSKPPCIAVSGCPDNRRIARAGGLYKRDFGKYHGVGLANAILPATADSENAEWKTLNVKHYPMFKKLEPVYPK